VSTQALRVLPSRPSPSFPQICNLPAYLEGWVMKIPTSTPGGEGEVDFEGLVSVRRPTILVHGAPG